MFQKRTISLVILTLWGCFAKANTQRCFFVSLTGNDNNTGQTLEASLASVQRAAEMVKAGDTIYVLGGVYKLTSSVSPKESGLPGKPIVLMNYCNENVTLDGSNFGRESKKVLRLSRLAYWHISGINISHAQGLGISIQDNSHDILIENLDSHHNRGTGVSLDAGSYNNIVRYVNSYFNYDDQTGGENADGFANKLEAVNNLFIYCKAWNNSDDGWDFWNGGKSKVMNCEAFNNGYDANGNTFPNGDGNGFKLGGQNPGYWSGDNVLVNCVAYNNYACGFVWNQALLKNALYNTTAYNNNKGRLKYACNYRMEHPGDVVINCISVGETQRINLNAKQEHNNWNLSIEKAGFQSTSPSDKNFLYLDAKSAMRHKGVRTEFVSKNAPDLGAFQYGDEWR